MYIYSSAPTKKIVAEFEIGNIIEDKPEHLWNDLKEVSGVDEREFFEYFRDRNIGFAIEIERLNIFEDPVDPKGIIHDFIPPQSFCYLDPLMPILL